MFHAVVTTIQEPTGAMWSLARRVSETGGTVIVVGDATGPAIYPVNGVEFIPFASQEGAWCAENHYARKNLGYLRAMENKPECIYETDDDNAPMRQWGKPDRQQEVSRCRSTPGWINVYEYFRSRQSGSLPLWPRGLPLAEIDQWNGIEAAKCAGTSDPIWQGLANLEPDVDAIWRMTNRSASLTVFEQQLPLVLPQGTWSPFNSQNTWWWPEAWPLMYLPSTCTSRTTDIWRGLVAQRCLWAMGRRVVFFSADVEQVRNKHDLLKDFKDEIDCYLYCDAVRKRLEGLTLDGEPAADMMACYEELILEGVIDDRELHGLRAWMGEINRLSQPARHQTCSLWSACR